MFSVGCSEKRANVFSVFLVGREAIAVIRRGSICGQIVRHSEPMSPNISKLSTAQVQFQFSTDDSQTNTSFAQFNDITRKKRRHRQIDIVALMIAWKYKRG